MTTKKKRLYLGLIIVGGCALVIDRLAFSGGPPAPAAASVPPPRPVPGAARTAPAAALGLDALESIPELVFPRKLPTVAEDQPLRDLFAPPAKLAPPRPMTDHQAAIKILSMGGVGMPPAFGTGTALDALAPPPPPSFEEQNPLDGIIVFGSSRIAVVGGRWLRVGDSIPNTPCKLVAVEERTATFDCGGEKKTLRLFENVLLRGN